MQATTIAFTCAGITIGTHRQSPASQYFSPPRQCDLTRNWRPMILARTEVGKTRRLCARANAEGEVIRYESGTEYYLDEQDVVTFLDPPKELIPLDPSSYNPASYLWKKIEDIPEERRHRLLSLLSPRLVSRAWEVAGRRYDDPKLVKKTASTLLSGGDCSNSRELWRCRTSGAPLQVAWVNDCQKAIFGGRNGKTYGRLIGGHPLSGIMNGISPLYFSVRQVNEVTATEQPCDFAYEFGDGVLNLADAEYPKEFPKPSKHLWPWNDEVVVYVRQLGPGVVVGQAWQEGMALQQVPKKLCNEMLMVKEYFA